MNNPWSNFVIAELALSAAKSAEQQALIAFEANPNSSTEAALVSASAAVTTAYGAWAQAYIAAQQAYQQAPPGP